MNVEYFNKLLFKLTDNMENKYAAGPGVRNHDPSIAFRRRRIINPTRKNCATRTGIFVSSLDFGTHRVWEQQRLKPVIAAPLHHIPKFRHTLNDQK